MRSIGLGAGGGILVSKGERGATLLVAGDVFTRTYAGRWSRRLVLQLRATDLGLNRPVPGRL